MNATESYLVNHALPLLFRVVDVKIRILWLETQHLEVIDLHNLVRLRSLDGVRLLIDVLNLVLLHWERYRVR
jgi:hypothetical protein